MLVALLVYKTGLTNYQENAALNVGKVHHSIQFQKNWDTKCLHDLELAISTCITCDLPVMF